MHKFAWLVLILICLLATLTYVLKGFRGGQITPSRWLFETGDCQQPCWHGIQLGKTTITEAEDILRGLTFISEIERDDRPNRRCDLSWAIDIPIPYWGCANMSQSQDGRIAQLWISLDREYQGIGVKDMFLILGVPDRAVICSGASGVMGSVYFGPNVEITIDRWDINGFPSPFHQTLPMRVDAGRVERIFYQQPGLEVLFKPDFPIWQGFTPVSKSYSIRVQPAYRIQC